MTTFGPVTVSMDPSVRVICTVPDTTLYVSTPERTVVSWVPSWKCTGSFAPGAITTCWSESVCPGAFNGSVVP